VFNRKKAKEEVAKIPSRKQTNYYIQNGDEVVLTMYGRYENGMVTTTGDSYFTISVPVISDPDITITKLITKIGKHA